MAKASKPKTSIKQLSLRVPVAQYSQAKGIVAKERVKNPSYSMTNFTCEAFTNEIDRRSKQLPRWTENVNTITPNEVAKFVSPIAPSVFRDVQALLKDGLGMTLNDFLRSAIENEVGKRSHKSPSSAVSIEIVSRQLDRLLDFAQEARKADAMTGLIALELGIVA